MRKIIFIISLCLLVSTGVFASPPATTTPATTTPTYEAPKVPSQLLLNLEYPKIGPGEGFQLNKNQGLNEIVAWFYYFIIAISGIAAFFMLVWGGLEWLTSMGNPSRVSSAKDRIGSALLGLIIILASYLILTTINPELMFLKLPGLL